MHYVPVAQVTETVGNAKGHIIRIDESEWPVRRKVSAIPRHVSVFLGLFVSVLHFLQHSSVDRITQNVKHSVKEQLTSGGEYVCLVGLVPTKTARVSLHHDGSTREHAVAL